MDIRNRTVLVLGGGGLVGSAVCRKLLPEEPKRIVLASVQRSESVAAIASLRKDVPGIPRGLLVPWGGNIFVRQSLKDAPRDSILADRRLRGMLIDDTLGELTEQVILRSTIFQLFRRFKPDVVIDCINSATAIAYQDLYTVARTARASLHSKPGAGKHGVIRENVERLLCTLYTPQLIRHLQLLYRSMNEHRTRVYVKIGTSGTGGMGLNIPYTHSEERPSSVLLSKSAVAGAHTMLLFLMGRTPDAPITKEIKPTAAIAWKRVAYGEIRKRGKPVPLVDCPPAQALRLAKTLDTGVVPKTHSLKKNLESVFIDTGENGLFARGEFEAIATPGQMEFVTPEEIADAVVYEIKGGNTGRDIINALDNATLSPTYRAGFLFQSALDSMMRLEREYGTDSVAFEMLGPPRLSKLLYEAYLLKRSFRDMRSVMKADPATMSGTLAARIGTDRLLRSQIISIGIPILLPDGRSLLRGPVMKIPAVNGATKLRVTPRSLDLWAHDGWVDLRVKNMNLWKLRFRHIGEMAGKVGPADTSSREMNTAAYWNDFNDIQPGKLAGWIFSYEEKGMRKKA